MVLAICGDKGIRSSWLLGGYRPGNSPSNYAVDKHLPVHRKAPRCRYARKEAKFESYLRKFEIDSHRPTFLRDEPLNARTIKILSCPLWVVCARKFC